ncbi:MAG: hypothetical protein JJU28_11170 [Cyclobacteriaceae bacterium]|nr:hypothetical protein [Cyclobacteriaceae bacterium]
MMRIIQGKINRHILPATIFFSILFLFSACLKDLDLRPGEMDLIELLAAPDTLQIGSQRITMRTQMWRDFRTSTESPEDGGFLNAIFWIYSIDSTALPGGFSADAAWIVLGEQVWDTYLTGEAPPVEEQLSFQLFEVARNGPKWGPGDLLTTVVRLRDRQGRRHLLRASNQTVERLEDDFE